MGNNIFSQNHSGFANAAVFHAMHDLASSKLSHSYRIPLSDEKIIIH